MTQVKTAVLRTAVFFCTARYMVRPGLGAKACLALPAIMSEATTLIDIAHAAMCRDTGDALWRQTAWTDHIVLHAAGNISAVALMGDLIGALHKALRWRDKGCVAPWGAALSGRCRRCRGRDGRSCAPFIATLLDRAPHNIERP